MRSRKELLAKRREVKKEIKDMETEALKTSKPDANGFRPLNFFEMMDGGKLEGQLDMLNWMLNISQGKQLSTAEVVKNALMKKNN